MGNSYLYTDIRNPEDLADKLETDLKSVYDYKNIDIFNDPESPKCAQTGYENNYIMTKKIAINNYFTIDFTNLIL